MASRNSSRVLTDHDEIRRWAEERDARPSAVQRTHTDDSVGIIRLDFPGYSGENSLEEIEWDEWFDKFDDNNLALIVQDQSAGGERSNFNKIVSRDSLESAGGSRSRAKKSTSARGSTAKKSSARAQGRSTASGKKKKSKSTSHRRAA
ncbi:MAG: hypothetical protein ACM3ND_15540 [Acidobacteriota bacterium]|jgi:hypothetical protein